MRSLRDDVLPGILLRQQDGPEPALEVRLHQCRDDEEVSFDHILLNVVRSPRPASSSMRTAPFEGKPTAGGTELRLMR